jgi:hypothetical protein
MNYKFLMDQDELERFIDWLPDLEEHEIYYLAAFTRKKYCSSEQHPWIKADKNHIRRFTSTKERLVSKIKQLECPIGSYTMKGKGGGEFVVPQESLVLYITPSPRDLWKATIQGAIDLMKVVQCQGKNSNPHQEILSTIQRTASKKRVVTFDVDEKSQNVLDRFTDVCGKAVDVVETRGGYHFLVHPKEMPKNEKWYQTLSEVSDVTGDALLPVPGTFQGGFSVKMIINNH